MIFKEERANYANCWEEDQNQNDGENDKGAWLREV